jgi:hypothetical protein
MVYSRPICRESHFALKTRFGFSSYAVVELNKPALVYMVEMGDSNPLPLTCEAQKTDQAEQNRTTKAASDEWPCLISFAPVLGDSDQIGGTMAE